MTVTDAQFAQMGWTRGTHVEKVYQFQAAYNLGPWLAADGKDGPLTTAAAGRVLANGNRLSPHFTTAEFTCQCGGKYADCFRVRAHRTLLQSLETYRADFAPGGVTIISGYRCPQHNRQVGGAADSQHMYGTAADVHGPDYRTVAAKHLFAGIGYGGTTKTTQHVDRRDQSGHNNGGTLVQPIEWKYNNR